MGKRLERVCDHLFWDIDWKDSWNTQILAQDVKWKSCKIIEIWDSLYNYSKEVGRKELGSRGMITNLDIWF